MFAKSKQIGLVSLLVVLGAALGGCAESVGNEPASFANNNRPVLALSRFSAPPLEPDSFQSIKAESVATRTEPKHLVRPVAENH